MSRDIRTVIVTVDRAPRENYLRYTLDDWARSGCWRSPRYESLHVVDSGSEKGDDEVLWWPDRALIDVAYVRVYPGQSFDAASPPHCFVHYAPERRSGKQNAAAALRIGADGHKGWVLFMEDDVALCDDFLGSVGRWLDRHEGDDLTRPKRAIYPFSSDNAAIRTAQAKGETSWEYHVSWFWGLQCFACRPAVALDLAAWFEAHPVFRHTDGRPDLNAHDLEMHHWARERGYEHFRGSAPSFVQHIGFETSIAGNVMGGQRVTFPSWPGRDWSFA